MHDQVVDVEVHFEFDVVRPVIIGFIHLKMHDQISEFEINF